MSSRILLGCYHVPGWSGSSTVLYHLFERMQRDCLPVSYVNLLTEQDELFLRQVCAHNFGNPHRLENVHTCIVKPPLWRAQAGLTALIECLAPDLLLGFGLIATRLFELAAPRIPVVFMTAGSRQLGYLIETRAIRDFLGFRKRVEQGVAFPMATDHPERQAVENSDLIIVHSPLIRFAFDHFFSNHNGKIYSNIISIADLVFPEADRFKHLKKPFNERDIDIIFVASRWSRPEKNYALVRKIVRRCGALNVHIVGEVDRPCPPARHHGRIVGREALYELLGRSKTLVCPSSLDAAPAVLFEASGMGCNVIASPNCGNWDLCNERLVSENCSEKAFFSKIEMSLNAPYEANQERFRGGYEDLVETLSVC
jgi:hypothetical protein